MRSNFIELGIIYINIYIKHLSFLGADLLSRTMHKWRLIDFLGIIFNGVGFRIFNTNLSCMYVKTSVKNLSPSITVA